MKIAVLLLPLALAAAATASFAQPIANPPTDLPSVTLTATANMQVDNDRMTIVLQVESEKPNAAVAAAEVNGRMAKALAMAKAVPGVTAKTLNYSTNQVMEKGKMVRWRVSQLLQIETADFTAGANLATRLQEDGLLLSSLTFGVSPEARRKAMVTLQHDALMEWRSVAKQAATSLGYAGFSTGRLAVNSSDTYSPVPRFGAMAMAARAADSVTVSAGSSELVTTVSGEAILTGEVKRQ